MRHALLASAVLALAAANAQAQARLELYASPSNYLMLGLSAGGASAVSYNGSGTGTNVWLPSPGGVFVPIGGNAPGIFSGSLGISADGTTISGAARAPNGYSQAATYNTTTGSWTTLGSLGFNATAVIQGQQQQSAATAISSDGSTVGGLRSTAAAAPATPRRPEAWPSAGTAARAAR